MGEIKRRASSAGPQLGCYEDFPQELLDVAARDLWRYLPGPSLFSLPGRNPHPLFVTALLHGNENTGWSAVQELLRNHKGRELPRRLIVFVGNIEAAKANVRTLDNQTDYNRTWPGTRYPESPEAALMRQVIELVAAERPFASVDIHNNSGNNPHYGCVNHLNERFFHLARLFSRTVVFFTRPVGVQSAAMGEICPAVTVECGVPDSKPATAHAAQFLDAALSLDHFPDHPLPDSDLELLQTAVILRVPPDANFTYDGSDADFRFAHDIDRLNFSELEAGTRLGRLGGNLDRRLAVIPGAEFDADTESYIEYVDGEIRLAQSVIPAMLTRDPRAVRLDCLGYLMHRINRNGRRIDDA